MAKIEIFPLCIGYSCTTLWVTNSLEIALSLTVFKIFILFHFSLKIQDGRQNWRKLKFFPYSQDTSVLPCGSKNLLQIVLSLMVFVILTLHFLLPKVAKIEIFSLRPGILLNYPVGQNWLFLLPFIFSMFYFPTKIQDSRQNGEN